MQNFEHLPLKQRLRKYADQLNSQQFTSDLWLKRNWNDIKHKDDKFNSPEGYYIPDLINRKYKYLIECDWFSHDEQKQKNTDFKRDLFFMNLGYKVFRVKYLHFERLNEIKKAVLSLRGEVKKSKIILRKKID